MKYIRREDGVIVDTRGIIGDVGKYIEDYAIKQADTIEELFDEYIHKNYAFKSLEELYDYWEDLYEREEPIYGAIWIAGEHDEPILKSVAKMKVISPNEIDWELL